MSEHRLVFWRKFTLGMYLVSFVLPVDRTLGIGIFVSCLIYGFYIPLFLVFWAPNPLFWVGYVALRRGRPGSCAVLASVAVLPASFWLVGIVQGVTRGESSELISMVGYFVWLGSMISLAAIGLLGYCPGVLTTRPRFRIRTFMVVTAFLAVVLAILSRVLD